MSGFIASEKHSLEEPGGLYAALARGVSSYFSLSLLMRSGAMPQSETVPLLEAYRQGLLAWIGAVEGGLSGGEPSAHDMREGLRGACTIATRIENLQISQRLQSELAAISDIYASYLGHAVEMIAPYRQDASYWRMRLWELRDLEDVA